MTAFVLPRLFPLLFSWRFYWMFLWGFTRLLVLVYHQQQGCCTINSGIALTGCDIIAGYPTSGRVTPAAVLHQQPSYYTRSGITPSIQQRPLHLLYLTHPNSLSRSPGIRARRANVVSTQRHCTVKHWRHICNFRCHTMLVHRCPVPHNARTPMPSATQCSSTDEQRHTMLVHR